MSSAVHLPSLEHPAEIKALIAEFAARCTGSGGEARESRSDRGQGGIGAEPAIANRPVIAKSGVAPAI